MIAPGMQNLGAAAGYYAPILNGNRSAIANSLAPERGMITDYYRGAEKGIERAGVTGGQRDLAVAELNRDKVAKLAGLAPEARRNAATGIMDVGSRQLAAGNTTAGQGVSAKAAGAGMLAPVYGGQNQRAYADQLHQQDTSNAIGSAIFDTLKAAGGKKGGGKLPGQMPGFGAWSTTP